MMMDTDVMMGRRRRPFPPPFTFSCTRSMTLSNGRTASIDDDCRPITTTTAVSIYHDLSKPRHLWIKCSCWCRATLARVLTWGDPISPAKKSLGIISRHRISKTMRRPLGGIAERDQRYTWLKQRRSDRLFTVSHLAGVFNTTTAQQPHHWVRHQRTCSHPRFARHGNALNHNRQAVRPAGTVVHRRFGLVGAERCWSKSALLRPVVTS